MNALYEIAESIVLKAADYIQSSKIDIFIASEHDKDIKVNLDIETNKIICEALKQTDIPIISEENPIIFEVSETSSLYWVIDPLDGSFNLLKGYGAYCISVALYRGFDPVFGMVYDLQSNRLIKNNLNANSIQIGKTPFTLNGHVPIEKSVLYTGVPVGLDLTDEKKGQFYVDLSKFKKIRMIGSAATSLALVAQGIADVYIEKNIFLWDVAAGIALVNAAGGGCLINRNSNQPHILDIVAAGSMELARTAAEVCLWNVGFTPIYNTNELSQ